MAQHTPAPFDPTEVFDGLAGRTGRVLVGGHDGRGLRVGLACSAFNGTVTARLLDGALAALGACEVDPDDLTVAWVPGAFELPVLAGALCRSGVDATVCLGAVIRGETGHYDLVAGQCAAGLQRVQLDSGVPVAFGVLTTEDDEQALARSVPLDGEVDPRANKGYEAALTAVEMVNLLRDPALGAKASGTAPRAGGH